MNPPAFIGNEAAAAGYRLCGMHAVVPPAGEEAQALEDARARAPLVLIGADCAARMAPARLEAALAALAPPVLIVPDPLGGGEVPDVAARVRAQLGLEA